MRYIRNFAIKIPKLTFLLVIILFSKVSFGQGPEAVQGGVVFVPIDAPVDSTPKVHFNNNRVLTTKKDGQWVAVIGVPLDQPPGQAYVDVLRKKGLVEKYAFTVKAKAYPSERIRIKDKSKVTPPPKDMLRIKKEQKQLKRTLSKWDNREVNTLKLKQPVEGRISSKFGFKRIINDIPKSPHKGIDIAAKQGTPIKASAPGIVTLVDDLFFTGNTVVIDHGQGLQTIYCHLNETSVREGSKVDLDTTIGTVGKTGRATGPHLHFGVVLNQVKVDPSTLWNLNN